jgi:uncharacterized surface protein with fasciclin (FAS1) repeats
VIKTPIIKGADMQKNIVETARDAGTFTTLVADIDRAGLEPTLAGEGPFTVFAPSDEAFAQLPEGTVDSLLAEPAKPAQVLTYHVVPGRVTAAVLALASSVSLAVTSSFSRLNPTTEKLGSVGSGAGASQPWVRFDRGWSLR